MFRGALLKGAGLELAYFSGIARLFERRTGHAGAILKFEHVRPRRGDRFQPLKSCEITPEFLDAAVSALKRRKVDLLSLDEVIERVRQPERSQRFVNLSFDGGYRDFVSFAYPVLSRHRAPFTLYVPTGFVDRFVSPWWLALEQVIARNARIGLVMNGTEQRFVVEKPGEKRELYRVLHDWLMTLPPADLAVAIGDLCSRYGVDSRAISHDAAMTWSDLSKLAADPLATIGSATVNYPNLAHTKGTVALREMTMGRTVLETALNRSCRHFAYPFGGQGTFGPRDMLLAREAGFVSAASSEPGLLAHDGQSDLMALPRIPWDGRLQSTRVLSAILSGITIRTAKRHAPEPAADYG